MTLAVDRRVAEALFSPVDIHFADFIVGLAGQAPVERQTNLWLAAVLTSTSVGRGHVCLSLPEFAGTTLTANDDKISHAIVCPEIDRWVNDLQESPVTGKPGDFCPLILDDKNRLYLYRYWLYERHLAKSILNMTKSRNFAIDKELLARGLERAFPGKDEAVNWQKVAAALAALNRFTVISGGPGTGKTYTVGRILDLLVDQAKGDDMAIALAAPTGKAAARLTEMVRKKKDGMDSSPEAKRHIPEKALTIHRLLGPVYDAKTFRYNETNRLPYDVVVVDEASMIDLPLMAKLITSLKENSRLILLGDKDQLASVEPGAVFGDMCDTGIINTFSAELARTLGELTSHNVPYSDDQGDALPDSIVILQKSYRFGPDSGIGIVASKVNCRKPSEAIALLKDPDFNDVRWLEIPPPERLEQIIEDRYFPNYSQYLKSKSLEEAFSLFNSFHLLCALRNGPYGVTSINSLIERICSRRGLIPGTGRWYPCQPVMVTSNDYQLRLFNGDVGILFPDDEAGGELRVFFPAEEGGFRKLLPGRIKDYETVYAMTIHKSQGSEFNDVVIVLPDRFSDVLTKELIYTAVTRARRSVEIWGSESALNEALSRTTRRESGLKDELNKNRK